jgi:hypothetical protein
MGFDGPTVRVNGVYVSLNTKPLSIMRRMAVWARRLGGACGVRWSRLIPGF